jgi:hypothetical protein
VNKVPSQIETFHQPGDVFSIQLQFQPISCLEIEAILERLNIRQRDSPPIGQGTARACLGTVSASYSLNSRRMNVDGRVASQPVGYHSARFPCGR